MAAYKVIGVADATASPHSTIKGNGSEYQAGRVECKGRKRNGRNCWITYPKEIPITPSEVQVTEVLAPEVHATEVEVQHVNTQPTYEPITTTGSSEHLFAQEGRIVINIPGMAPRPTVKLSCMTPNSAVSALAEDAPSTTPSTTPSPTPSTTHETHVTPVEVSGVEVQITEQQAGASVPTDTTSSQNSTKGNGSGGYQAGRVVFKGKQRKGRGCWITYPEEIQAVSKEVHAAEIRSTEIQEVPEVKVLGEVYGVEVQAGQGSIKAQPSVPTAGIASAASSITGSSVIITASKVALKSSTVAASGITSSSALATAPHHTAPEASTAISNPPITSSEHGRVVQTRPGCWATYPTQEESPDKSTTVVAPANPPTTSSTPDRVVQTPRDCWVAKPTDAVAARSMVLPLFRDLIPPISSPKASEKAAITTPTPVALSIELKNKEVQEPQVKTRQINPWGVGTRQIRRGWEDTPTMSIEDQKLTKQELAHKYFPYKGPVKNRKLIHPRSSPFKLGDCDVWDCNGNILMNDDGTPYDTIPFETCWKNLPMELRLTIIEMSMEGRRVPIKLIEQKKTGLPLKFVPMIQPPSQLFVNQEFRRVALKKYPNHFGIESGADPKIPFSWKYDTAVLVLPDTNKLLETVEILDERDRYHITKLAVDFRTAAAYRGDKEYAFSRAIAMFPRLIQLDLDVPVSFEHRSSGQLGHWRCETFKHANGIRNALINFRDDCAEMDPNPIDPDWQPPFTVRAVNLHWDGQPQYEGFQEHFLTRRLLASQLRKRGEIRGGTALFKWAKEWEEEIMEMEKEKWEMEWQKILELHRDLFEGQW